MSILIVDDYPAIARTLQRLLKPLGRHVVTAGCVAEGIEIADQAANLRQPFEVVVSDIDMPDGTGFDMVHALFMRWPLWRPKVVFMTGDANPARVAAAAQLGAVLIEKSDLKRVVDQVAVYCK